MFRAIKYLTICFSILLFSSFVATKPEKAISKYKCMVQLINYTGEGAYIIVSLLDKEGNYLKTLKVLGDDEEWYPDLRDWWVYYRGVNKPSIDGITGATIAGGERSVFVVEIEDEMLDSGKQIRFETAVEDQKYVVEDLQFSLTSDNVKGKFEGTGYIRYVRMIPNK